MPELILIARLLIPSIGLDVPMYFAPHYINEYGKVAWDIRYIEGATAVLQGTADPSEDYGNTVIAGHFTVPSNNAVGPFYRLSELGPGDEILIEQNGVRYRYVFEDTFIIDKSGIWITEQDGTRRVTLFTCTAPIATRERRVVRAQFKGATMIESTATPIVVVPTEIEWHPARTVTFPSPTPTIRPTRTVTSTPAPTWTVMPASERIMGVYEQPDRRPMVFLLLSSLVLLFGLLLGAVRKNL